MDIKKRLGISDNKSDLIINKPCPNCGVSFLFLGVGYLKSKENPVKIPPFVYCDNCGRFHDGAYKKYLPFVEEEKE